MFCKADHLLSSLSFEYATLMVVQCQGHSAAVFEHGQVAVEYLLLYAGIGAC